MTPAGHLAQGQVAQDAAASIQAGDGYYSPTEALLDAIAHYLAAIAGELGVPAPPPAPEGGSGG